MTSKLIAEIRGSAGYLVLNAPARRNALSLDMWEAIPGIVEGFAQDTHIRSIVVTGAGHEAFAAGADISEFDDHRATAESATALRRGNPRGHPFYRPLCEARDRRRSRDLLRRRHGARHGLRPAPGDRRCAKFCIPAAKLGVGYSYDGTAALVARLGPALTAETVVHRAHLQRARSFGERHRPRGRPGWRVRRLRRRATPRSLADNAPLSIAAAKSAIRAVLAGDGADARRIADARIAACMTSEDYREGRAAFLEKRKPTLPRTLNGRAIRQREQETKL